MTLSRRTATALLALVWMAPGAMALSLDDINDARFEDGAAEADARIPAVIRIQVILDRAHFSPGVIDGFTGGNTDKALAAYAGENALDGGGELDEVLWRHLTEADPDPVFTTYEITQDDLDEPLVDSIPESYAEQSRMERLSHTSRAEMLAERFHMDIGLLRDLNPDADFDAAGTEILVADVLDRAAATDVARIVVARGEASVRAYDAAGDLVAFYTATIGSEETPSPEGTHDVEVVVRMPNYTYRPREGSSQGDEALVLPPGPNNPVGSVWIGLTEPGYGIHGTPDPALIDKTYSLGCVRLTNWDAEELADLVDAGTAVEFVD